MLNGVKVWFVGALQEDGKQHGLHTAQMVAVLFHDSSHALPPSGLERKIVTELTGAEAESLHESLSRIGFRRSHSIAYAPACPECSACISVRIIVNNIQSQRAFRRVLRPNKDLKAHGMPAYATVKQYQLFSRYQEARHDGIDMALMGFYDYCSMIEDSPIDTFTIEFRCLDDTLAAVILTDHMSDSTSAIYSFFKHNMYYCSLGTYMILWLVEEAQRLDLPYIYLGYWIAESRKMSCKITLPAAGGFWAGGLDFLTGVTSNENVIV